MIVAKKRPQAAVSNPAASRALVAMRKELGEDSVQFLGSDEMSMKIRGVISTQCPTLDAAIGRGGIPLGRLTILYGKEGGGKTTVALHCVSECQRMGGIVLYIDKEHKLDPDYASALGVRTKEVLFGQPTYLENVIKQMKKMIEHARSMRAAGDTRPVLIVLDSINAAKAKPSKEKKEIGERHYPDEARIWSDELPQVIEDASKERVALLFISQVRKKLGIMFGDPDDLAGGNAPKFYASLIIRVQRTGSAKDKKQNRISNITEGWCQKNQISPPFKKAMFQIRFGRGVDFELALIEQAIADEILEVKGTRVVYNGEVVGTGKEDAALALRKNREWRMEINKALRVKRGWKKEMAT